MEITILFKKKPETKSRNVDIREAFTLWDVFNSKYMAMEKLLVHVRSFNKFTANHRLRAFMKKLLSQEVEKIDDYIRYGKLKGWLHTVPR